ncbi:MAG: copper amine oxidase N-terminal domain-containing protein [Defluviitaleaceae bacterium]|nr:copper amine oxidase N-terminal domain-containing protein [Defluviitaleaceae bacterium]
MKTYKKHKFNIRHLLSTILVATFIVVTSIGHVALTASSATSSAALIFANLGVQDAPQRPTIIGLEITGQIPIAQTGNSRLDNELEERWTSQYNAFMQNHAASALSIDSSVEHFTSTNFVSTAFIKEASSVSTTAVISTTVIDTSTSNIITLPEFNVNILQIVNNYIDSQIAARPHGFASFSGIDASHPFYLDGDLLVIPFGSAELIPTERGIHRITLSISNIEEHVFTSDSFRVLEPTQYNTIMIRLGDVMRSFGYEVRWDNITRTASILMDGVLVSTVTIGENSYYYLSGRARELEVAPMLFDNLTYVPLSFFSEVVGIPTTVSSIGITASRYHFSTTITMNPALNDVSVSSELR